MRRDGDLWRALGGLIGLGLVTAGLATAHDALSGPARAGAVALLLLLAALKAEIILSRYLALVTARDWRGAFRSVIVILALILYGTWLIPGLSQGWWGAPQPAANASRE